MAIRTCPNCAVQYVGTVRRCIDCDVMLVDEKRAPDAPEPAPSAASPVGDGDQVGYELDGWGTQLKNSLDGMLLRAGIRRVWEVGALVVAAEHEAEVDELIATLEGHDLAELDDDTPRVALEIDGLDADRTAELDARLIADALAHAWDEEGALVVAEADEAQVLAIIDAVFDDDEDDGDEGGDGLAAHQALSTLYVAVDRLLRNPHDRKLATAYVSGAADLNGYKVPYGFAGAEWNDLLAEAATLADAVRPYGDQALEEQTADGAEDEPEGGDDRDDAPAPMDPDEATEVLEADRDMARALRTRLAELV